MNPLPDQPSTNSRHRCFVMLFFHCAQRISSKSKQNGSHTIQMYIMILYRPARSARWHHSFPALRSPKMSPNVPENKNPRLALILAAGATVTAAAEELGISRKTVQRKLAKPAFRRRVAELRAQLFGAALGRIADSLTRATDSLAALLDSNHPAVRLRAATLILSLGMKMRDSVDVSDRVAELEAELARKQGLAP
jgi:hypothetical protein